MKILFVGYHNPKFMSLPDYVERAIIDLGHTLDVFDYRKWAIPGRLREKFPLLQTVDIARLNRSLVQQARRSKPDLILASGAWTILPETIRTIRSFSKAITVLWIADFPLKFPEYLKAGPAYHHFFAGGTDALKLYQDGGGTNGSWLTFACDPDIHKPVQLTEEEKRLYAHDICYVGSRVTERVALLEQLCDFDIGIWGPGWDTLPRNSPLRSRIFGGIVTPDTWIKIFSASKIVLNIIGGSCDVFAPFIDDKDFRIANTKVFEILGCGSFQMVDAKADVLSLFTNGKHLVCYHDALELRELIRAYLERPDERKKIAEAGNIEVLKKHTYRHRVSEILSTVEKELR